MKFAVMSDGACDLSDELLKEYNLKVVPFYINYDGTNYLKEKVDIKIHELYQMMVDNPKLFPKTSMPTTMDFVEVFEEYAKAKMPLIFVTITDKFSGSYNNACLAKQQILDEYPDAEIEVINSITNTCIQGLYVLEIAKMRDAGWEFQDAVKRAYELRETTRIFFTVDGLSYLQHGGRIGKVAGIVGRALGIKPLIVLKEGEIHALGIALSRKMSISKVINSLKKHFTDNDLDYHDYNFVVGFGYDKEEGEQLREKILQTFEGASCELAQIGATIGVHTGPYPLGVGIVKRFDK